MTLAELLAANPTAKAEYDKALADARSEGEAKAKADIKGTMDKVSPILASVEYSQSVKDLGIKAILGEKSYETFEAVVAVADMNKEQGAQAAAQGEEGNGGEETPPAGDMTDDEKALADYEARKKRLNEGEV